MIHVSNQSMRTAGYFSNARLGLYLPFQFNPTVLRVQKDTNYYEESITGLDNMVLTWVSGGSQTIQFELEFDGRPVNQKTTGAPTMREPFGIFKQMISNPMSMVMNQQIPGGAAAVDLTARVKQILFGLQIGQYKALYENTARYETLDGIPYDADLGVLPHIAILDTFLRPESFDLESMSAEFSIFGSMQSQFDKVKQLQKSSQIRKFMSPPYCYFHYGPRVFKTKLRSAPIEEIIHNEKLVPTRIKTTVTLTVIEVGEVYEQSEQHRIAYAFGFSNDLKAQNSINDSFLKLSL